MGSLEARLVCVLEGFQGHEKAFSFFFQFFVLFLLRFLNGSWRHHPYAFKSDRICRDVLLILYYDFCYNTRSVVLLLKIF